MARKKDEQKRISIFDATLTLVLQTGYTGLKMADVAKKAGVATGTVYKYFPSKECLIDNLFLHQKEIKLREMTEGYQPGEPFLVSFKRMWTNYFMGCINNPERMIFIEQFYRSPYISASTREKAGIMIQPSEDLLRMAIQQQLIRNLPVSVLLSQLMGAANEIARFHIDSGQIPTHNQLDQYFEMSLNSIRR